MQLSLKTIKPNPRLSGGFPLRRESLTGFPPKEQGNIMYHLPIEYQKVIDGDCSGVYCFVHKESGKYGISGSAISFRNRLNDHMNSFYGNRLRSHLHD